LISFSYGVSSWRSTLKLCEQDDSSKDFQTTAVYGMFLCITPRERHGTMIRDLFQSVCPVSLALLAACTTLPQFSETEPVSLRFLDAPDFHLNIVEPSARPGSLAGETAKEAAGDSFEGCLNAGVIGVILSPVCAAIGAAAGAAGGAATGAAVSAAQTLPEDDATALSAVSSQLMSSRDWSQTYLNVLKQTANAHHVLIDDSNEHSRLSVHLRELEWHIVPGNQARIHSTVWVVLQHKEERHTRSYEVMSQALQVDKWVVDQGQPIADALNQLFADTAEEIWSDLSK
jgi:hypothetical protein